MGIKLISSMTAGAAAILFQSMPLPAMAQSAGASALSGQVSSDAEGKMEGVVVTANQDGSIVSVSVTSDAKGHYSFPKNRLEPGKYTLAIRAIGYDLSAKATAQVAADTPAVVDLTLKKTADLASQMTNAEWMMSIPGSESQKAFLLNCTSCHTLERIVRSTHDADEWMQVVPRMMGYGAVSQPVKPQPMLDRARAGTPAQYRKVAEYLATINLSATDHWTYPLKTLPRPTGESTRAIVTEYRLPRPTIEPHDVLLDAQGKVWFTDFGEPFIDKFDPKTLKLTEYPTKVFKAAAPVGNLELAKDKEGAFWFDTMYQGAIGTMNPKTDQMKYYPVPAKWNDNRVQLNFVGLRHDVDGKVWTKNVGTNDVYRVDINTGKWEKFRPTDLLTGGPAGIYELISDSKNNAWIAEFADGHLGKIDAKTGQVTWYPTPTPHARARRMEIDSQDRILLTEYAANKIAQFDTRAEKWTEYPLPTPYTAPYRAQRDKNGQIWTDGMSTDRVVRLDPKTGKTIEYLMPSDTNMRSLYLDNSTTPVTFWTGSNHAATLVKVEPLD